MGVPFLAQISGLIAQEGPQIVPGTRIRVTAPTVASDRLVGTAMSLDVDTLVMKAEDWAAPLTVPIASVTRLDVSRGKVSRGKNALKGAGIGLLVGGAGGYVVEASVEGDQAIAPIVGAIGGAVNGSLIGASGKYATIGFLSGAVAGTLIGLAMDKEGDDTDAQTWALIGASFGGEIGILLGALAGLSSETERWEKVSLDRVRVGISPRRDGLAVSASLAL